MTKEDEYHLASSYAYKQLLEERVCLSLVPLLSRKVRCFSASLRCSKVCAWPSSSHAVNTLQTG